MNLKVRHLFHCVLGIIIFMLVSCDEDEISEDQSRSFIKFYNFSEEDIGNSVVKRSGGGYAVLTTIQTPNNNSGSDICLIFTDEFGNISDSIKYINGIYNEVGSRIMAYNSGYIIIGSKCNTITNPDIFVARVDSLGDLIWSRTVGGAYSDKALALCISEDNDILITGYIERKVDEVIDKDIFLFGFTENGDYLWTDPIVFNQGYEDYGAGIAIANNEIIIAGTTKSTPTVNNASDIFILKCNMLGQQTAYETFVESGLNDCKELVVDENNQFYYITGTTTYSSVINPSDILILKINSSLQKVWVRNCNISPEDFGSKILLVDNDLYIMRFRRLAGEDKNSQILILHTTTSNVEPIRLMMIGLNSNMESLDFTFNSDGGFIITGKNTSLNNTDIFILKTKSLQVTF